MNDKCEVCMKSGMTVPVSLCGSCMAYVCHPQIQICGHDDRLILGSLMACISAAAAHKANGNQVEFEREFNEACKIVEMARHPLIAIHRTEQDAK